MSLEARSERRQQALVVVTVRRLNLGAELLDVRVGRIEPSSGIERRRRSREITVPQRITRARKRILGSFFTLVR